MSLLNGRHGPGKMTLPRSPRRPPRLHMQL